MFFQGFQLVFEDPRDKRGGSRARVGCYDNIFSLQQAIDELSEEIKSKSKRVRRRPVQIVARFSLGRVFHKVELAYPDLVISIYKSK